MAEALQIQVNGLPRDCRSGSTVGDLLRELDIKTERVAVELNLEILDRNDFELRSLKAGDRVEILSFIGGGGLVFGERMERGRTDV
ncbi:MAG TPA: sulfur carrier protein ThiS [Nitrospira sp.]|jgi:thiamine biosynthesis protein ThiS|nr:sulfur carrier protein ThiS [Nitrospira sp.]